MLRMPHSGKATTSRQADPAVVSLQDSFVEGFLEFEKVAIKICNRINKSNDTVSLGGELEGLEEFFDSYLSPLGKIAKSMSHEEREAHLEFVVSSYIHGIMARSPIVWRAFFKPLGYAGDFSLMEMCYRNTFEGPDPFSRLVHKTMVSKFSSAEALRSRKAYIKSKIADADGGKVLNMAAGSAREIREYLQENPTTKTQFLALDHDMEALRETECMDPRCDRAIANAFHFIRGENSIAFPRTIPFVKHRHVPSRDFKGIQKLLAPLHYKITPLASNSFNLVYSLGLYDYILNFDTPKKGCKALTKFLFDKVAPGGKLIIGNFNWSMPDLDYFVMEFIGNWKLLYRHDEEIYSFLDGIDAHLIADAHIEHEETGVNSFLVVTKTML